MNVAIFASAFYPHTGGVEELCRQLAHAYSQQGHHSIILTNRWPRTLPRNEEYERIRVYRPAFRVPEGSLKARCSYALTYGLIRRQVARILSEDRIDVIHVQCVSGNGYYALLAQRDLGLPLVLSTQGERTMDAGRLYERSPFANYVLRELLDEADFVTACSKHTLDDLELWYGRPLERSEVVYNGIRPADFDGVQPYAHPKPYVLAMGRLVLQKGFDVLLAAFARAGVTSHDLIVAGEGPERAALVAQVAGLGLTSRVHFVGRADRPTAVALMAGCGLFVLPSRMEPQGIVVLEAMAAGKAVVASRVGGVPEVVRDGQTGMLVSPEDASSLSQAIVELLSDPERCLAMARAGKAVSVRFAWSSIADQYLSIYEQTVAGRVPARKRREVQRS